MSSSIGGMGQVPHQIDEQLFQETTETYNKLRSLGMERAEKVKSLETIKEQIASAKSDAEKTFLGRFGITIFNIGRKIFGEEFATGPAAPILLGKKAQLEEQLGDLDHKIKVQKQQAEVQVAQLKGQEIPPERFSAEFSEASTGKSPKQDLWSGLIQGFLAGAVAEEGL